MSWMSWWRYEHSEICSQTRQRKLQMARKSVVLYNGSVQGREKSRTLMMMTAKWIRLWALRPIHDWSHSENVFSAGSVLLESHTNFFWLFYHLPLCPIASSIHLKSRPKPFLRRRLNERKQENLPIVQFSLHFVFCSCTIFACRPANSVFKDHYFNCSIFCLPIQFSKPQKIKNKTTAAKHYFLNSKTP